MARANLRRLAQKMDDAQLAGVVASTAENIRYFTGIDSVPLEMFPHTGQSFVVLARHRLDEPVFVSSKCEVDQALHAEVELSDVVGYGTFYRELPDGVRLTADERALARFAVAAPDVATAADGLRAAVRSLGLLGERVAVDEDALAAPVADAVASWAPAGALLPAAALLRDVRKVKTPAEIDRLVAAARLAEDGIRAAAAIACPGTTEVDLVREFEHTVVAGGGRPKFTLIKIGRAAVAGQTAPTLTKLERGDAIWFDVGCVVDGYWSDIARVYTLGEPTARVAGYYQAALAGEEAALSAARPGMAGGELFDITVDAVRDSGIPHYHRHHVGHGIGVEVYDRVLLTPENPDRLEPGTVVNVETPYYEFGLGAIHVEDPFLVTEDGNRLLTTLDRRLQVID